MALDSLVREYPHPVLLQYVLNNLPRQVAYPAYRHCMMATFDNTRRVLTTSLTHPRSAYEMMISSRRKRADEIVKKMLPQLDEPIPQEQVLRKLFPKLADPLPLQNDVFLKNRMEEFWKPIAKYQHDMFKELLKNQKEQQRLFLELCDTMLKEPEDKLLERLRDPMPAMRMLTIQAIARKRLHREQEMIDLLSDQHPMVRQAARQALVVLSRGNDFGPAPNANAQQFELSRQQWRSWLSLQNEPIHEQAAAP